MPFHVVLASAAVAAAMVLLVWSVRGPQVAAVPVRRGLEPLSTDLRRLNLDRSFADRLAGPGLQWLAGRARRFTPVAAAGQLERRLALAGLQGRWPLEQVLVAKLLLGAVGFLLGLSRLGAGGSGLLFAGCTIALGYFTPDVVLLGRGRERQRRIQQDLPDVLDQITISVEAGLAFDSALARIGRTGKGPVAEELSRTVQDVMMGTSRLAALSSLVDRTDVPDLRHFVMALKQAEQYGVPIAQVLRVQSQELREKRRQRAEEAALKLPVKLVFPLIFCILPALFVVILGPPALRVADSLFRL